MINTSQEAVLDGKTGHQHWDELVARYAAGSAPIRPVLKEWNGETWAELGPMRHRIGAAVTATGF